MTRQDDRGQQGPKRLLPKIEVPVIGAGFAGVEVAKRLGEHGVDATIIDRRNLHLFQPLLYQVATAALSATDVADPIRSDPQDLAALQISQGALRRSVGNRHGQPQLAHDLRS